MLDNRRWTGLCAPTALAAACLLLSGGCGDEKKTGTLVEKAPGQEAGEKASKDAMKAMMKGKTAKK
jgi:hypothetical protein